MKNKNLRMWSSILKQKEKLKVSGSTLQDYSENEWLLTSMMERLDDSYVFGLVEYCKDNNPQTGICQIAVTDDELDKYFYEDRKV